MELGFSAMDVPAAHGGRDTRVIDQVAVWEQLGRVTNALCWCFSEPHRWMFEACTPEQLARFVLPLMTGKRKECYAITESGSGSDVDHQTTARRVAGGYAITGEKWYVTSANHADYFILQATLADGPHAGSHCTVLHRQGVKPGSSWCAPPPFSHTFSDHHPIFRFNDVIVPESQRLGPEGDGMRHSHSWFRRERLMIAARCCGAASSLDRGSHGICRHAHDRRRAAGREADGPGDVRGQRYGALGRAAHHLSKRHTRTTAATS